jgi:hypothetical protein
MPSASEQRKVDRELRKLGFGGLDDPNLIPQIAFFIKNHEQFRNQLFSVDPEQRRNAYMALRPHLRFPAKPLDVYELEMKEMAERQQLPVENGTPYPTPYKPGEVGHKPKLEVVASKAIGQDEKRRKAKGTVFLVCQRCTRGEAFVGENRKAANRDAFEAGWRMNGKNPICPHCLAGRVQ